MEWSRGCPSCLSAASRAMRAAAQMCRRWQTGVGHAACRSCMACGSRALGTWTEVAAGALLHPRPQWQRGQGPSGRGKKPAHPLQGMLPFVVDLLFAFCQCALQVSELPGRGEVDMQLHLRMYVGGCAGLLVATRSSTQTRPVRQHPLRLPKLCPRPLQHSLSLSQSSRLGCTQLEQR